MSFIAAPASPTRRWIRWSAGLSALLWGGGSCASGRTPRKVETDGEGLVDQSVSGEEAPRR